MVELNASFTSAMSCNWSLSGDNDNVFQIRSVVLNVLNVFNVKNDRFC